jgi:hypothetical protein
MDKFVRPLNIEIDLFDELNALIEQGKFYKHLDRDEIYLKNRVSGDEDIWQETEPKFNIPIGELRSKIKNADDLRKALNYRDTDYCHWNKSVSPEIIKSIQTIEQELSININRVTLNRLRVTSGLNIHKDGVKKIHYPVITTDKAFFYDASDLENQKIYNLKQNKLYAVDTTRDHYVYNADLSDRIHLIMCYDGDINE